MPTMDRITSYNVCYTKLLRAEWYFDFVSPFAYLQAQRLDRLRDAGLEIHYQPVLFAALLDHWGQLGPAEIGPKRELTYRAALWRSAHDGIELSYNFV